MTKRKQYWALTLLLGPATVLSACAWYEQKPLNLVEVPGDFTFANTRSVALQISADPATLGASGWAALEIARPDGKVLYPRAVGRDHAVEVHLAIANKDAAVQATLTTDDKARHKATVPVAGNSTSFKF